MAKAGLLRQLATREKVSVLMCSDVDQDNTSTDRHTETETEQHTETPVRK